ncbi:D-alanyl-D-alanine carboxypeptidase family protein [Culicoidibacter larvae]|uniref:D-alanyl-D-alanine carboxypeptidase family protein n=2 Tax=Culicoidibacter larvae TaxID=2579976 RepID=A0A5R8QHI3_9FIRM|nr:D-alanyl-D-alanine carboxypeptidase family protein [Culicoidibacter larvae]
MTDYQDVFNMLKNHDLSDFTADEEAAVQANIAKMQAVLDNKQVDLLETTINELAASIDAHYMVENDVAITYKKGLIIANKNNCMPSSYAPGESAQAAVAFSQMAADAANEGLSLNDFSTYRSYSGQKSLYDRYVAADGQEAADRYSSRPGCSEHQTGLAFDIGGSNSAAWAETTFDDTEEAIWLANNAYKYGFILRYPPGKESVTGYMYESWHYRYVGDIAKTIYDSGKTLEEYLEVE